MGRAAGWLCKCELQAGRTGVALLRTWRILGQSPAARRLGTTVPTLHRKSRGNRQLETGTYSASASGMPQNCFAWLFACGLVWGCGGSSFQSGDQPAGGAGGNAAGGSVSAGGSAQPGGAAGSAGRGEPGGAAGAFNTGGGTSGGAGSSGGGAAGHESGGTAGHGFAAGSGGISSAGSGGISSAGSGGISSAGSGGGGVDPRCPPHTPSATLTCDLPGLACRYNLSSNCLCQPSSGYFCLPADPTCGPTSTAAAGASGFAAPIPAGGNSSGAAAPAPNRVCTCSSAGWTCSFGP
jgi:hypothetical protein